MNNLKDIKKQKLISTILISEIKSQDHIQISNLKMSSKSSSFVAVLPKHNSVVLAERLDSQKSQSVVAQTKDVVETIYLSEVCKRPNNKARISENLNELASTENFSIGYEGLEPSLQGSARVAVGSLVQDGVGPVDEGSETAPDDEHDQKEKPTAIRNYQPQEQESPPNCSGMRVLTDESLLCDPMENIDEHLLKMSSVASHNQRLASKANSIVNSKPNSPSEGPKVDTTSDREAEILDLQKKIRLIEAEIEREKQLRKKTQRPDRLFLSNGSNGSQLGSLSTPIHLQRLQDDAAVPIAQINISNAFEQRHFTASAASLPSEIEVAPSTLMTPIKLKNPRRKPAIEVEKCSEYQNIDDNDSEETPLEVVSVLNYNSQLACSQSAGDPLFKDDKPLSLPNADNESSSQPFQKCCSSSSNVFSLASTVKNQNFSSRMHPQQKCNSEGGNLQSQVDDQLDVGQVHSAKSVQMKRPGHKKYQGSVRSANSANSIQSLNEEGFSRQRESENEKMWKIVETLRNNSSLLKDKQSRSNGDSAFQMEIIEEEVVLEGQGTDFKNYKRSKLGISTQSTIREHISPKLKLGSNEKENQATRPQLDISSLMNPRGSAIAFGQGEPFQMRYFDPQIYADPPSASEPPSAYQKASELNSSFLREDPLKNLESPTFQSLRRLSIKNLKISSAHGHGRNKAQRAEETDEIQSQGSDMISQDLQMEQNVRIENDKEIERKISPSTARSLHGFTYDSQSPAKSALLTQKYLNRTSKEISIKISSCNKSEQSMHMSDESQQLSNPSCLSRKINRRYVQVDIPLHEDDRETTPVGEEYAPSEHKGISQINPLATDHMQLDDSKTEKDGGFLMQSQNTDLTQVNTNPLKASSSCEESREELIDNSKSGLQQNDSGNHLEYPTQDIAVNALFGSQSTSQRTTSLRQHEEWCIKSMDGLNVQKQGSPMKHLNDNKARLERIVNQNHQECQQAVQQAKDKTYGESCSSVRIADSELTSEEIKISPTRHQFDYVKTYIDPQQIQLNILKLPMEAGGAWEDPNTQIRSSTQLTQVQGIFKQKLKTQTEKHSRQVSLVSIVSDETSNHGGASTMCAPNGKSKKYNTISICNIDGAKSQTQRRPKNRYQKIVSYPTIAKIGQMAKNKSRQSKLHGRSISCKGLFQIESSNGADSQSAGPSLSKENLDLKDICSKISKKNKERSHSQHSFATSGAKSSYVRQNPSRSGSVSGKKQYSKTLSETTPTGRKCQMTFSSKASSLKKYKYQQIRNERLFKCKKLTDEKCVEYEKRIQGGQQHGHLANVQIGKSSEQLHKPIKKQTKIAKDEDLVSEKDQQDKKDIDIQETKTPIQILDQHKAEMAFDKSSPAKMGSSSCLSQNEENSIKINDNPLSNPEYLNTSSIHHISKSSTVSIASEDFHEYQSSGRLSHQEVIVKFKNNYHQPRQPCQSPSKPNTMMTSPCGLSDFQPRPGRAVENAPNLTSNRDKKVQVANDRENKNILIEDNYSNASSPAEVEAKEIDSDQSGQSMSCPIEYDRNTAIVATVTEATNMHELQQYMVNLRSSDVVDVPDESDSRSSYAIVETPSCSYKTAQKRQMPVSGPNSSIALMQQANKNIHNQKAHQSASGFKCPLQNLNAQIHSRSQQVLQAVEQPAARLMGNLSTSGHTNNSLTIINLMCDPSCSHTGQSPDLLEQHVLQHSQAAKPSIQHKFHPSGKRPGQNGHGPGSSSSSENWSMNAGASKLNVYERIKLMKQQMQSSAQISPGVFSSGHSKFLSQSQKSKTNSSKTVRSNFGPMNLKSADGASPDIRPKFLAKEQMPSVGSCSQQSQNSRKSFRQPKQVPINSQSLVYDPIELDERISRYDNGNQNAYFQKSTTSKIEQIAKQF